MRKIEQGPSHWVDLLPPDDPRAIAITRGLVAKRYFFSDEEYGHVLSGVVVACVDIALQRESDGHFLLGVRANEPFRGGLAFTGGRMRPGESFHDSALRHAMRDFGLELSPDRFVVVRTDSWAWSKRAQSPQDAGCHMTGTTLYAELCAEEDRRVKLLGDSTELAWMSAGRILGDPVVHPNHKAAVRDILAGRFQS